MRWLSDIKMDHPGQQIVLQEYIDTFGECNRRVQRLTDQIRQLVAQWRLSAVVQALCQWTPSFTKLADIKFYDLCPFSLRPAGGSP